MEKPVAPPPPPPPPPAEKPVKETITLKVEFDTDKADIKPKYDDDIARVAAYLKKYPDTTVTIEGHTDSTDGAKWNQKLSEMRAESVKNYLVSKFGIAASRISTKGYGAAKPIADNKTKEGKQKNRRIEAIFR
jgi:OOP family OmpA-OmpF porin